MIKLVVHRRFFPLSLWHVHLVHIRSETQRERDDRLCSLTLAPRRDEGRCTVSCGVSSVDIEEREGKKRGRTCARARESRYASTSIRTEHERERKRCRENEWRELFVIFFFFRWIMMQKLFFDKTINRNESVSFDFHWRSDDTCFWWINLLRSKGSSKGFVFFFLKMMN